jgi:outer membrane protein assembly factor BamB
MSAIVTANSRIFYTGAHQLITLNEHNGKIDWRRDYSSLPDLVPPAVSDGKVFFSTLGYSDTYLYALDQTNGNLLYQSAYYAQWDHYLSATIDRGVVYTGNLRGFDTTSGTMVMNSGFSDHDGWTTAADEQYLYAYVGDIYNQPNSLRIVERATGQLFARIEQPTDIGSAPYTTRSAPILGALGNVICVDGASGVGYYTNKLVSFDTTSQSVRWFVAGQFPANPAYADGVLYITNRATKKFEARSESTGAVLWTWTPPTDEPEFVGDVLATDNLIFFSTSIATYAIDKTTHESVWRYPVASRVAISSNGLLLLSSPWTRTLGGDVVAFDID